MLYIFKYFNLNVFKIDFILLILKFSLCIFVLILMCDFMLYFCLFKEIV